MIWTLDEDDAKILNKELKTLSKSSNTDLLINGNTILQLSESESSVCKIYLPDRIVEGQDSEDKVVPVDKLVNMAKPGKIIFKEDTVEFQGAEFSAETPYVDINYDNSIDMEHIRQKQDLKMMGGPGFSDIRDAINKVTSFTSKKRIDFVIEDDEMRVSSGEKTDIAEKKLNVSINESSSSIETKFGKEVIKPTLPRVIDQNPTVYGRSEMPFLFMGEKDGFEYKCLVAPLIVE